MYTCIDTHTYIYTHARPQVNPLANTFEDDLGIIYYFRIYLGVRELAP